LLVLAVPALVVPALAMPGCLIDTTVVEGADAGTDDTMGGAGAEGDSGGKPYAGASFGGGGTGGVSTGGVSTGGVSIGGASNGGIGPGGAPTGGAPPTGGSSGGPSACLPQRVSGIGLCTTEFGPFFLGGSCGSVSGCSCEGEDCDSPYESEEACLIAHRGCITGCTPQEAAFVGTCEPGMRRVFTGVECVDMVGCSCVGDDCDSAYWAQTDPTDPFSCETAHAHCVEMPRSCEEIVAVYNEYASRDACEDDSDCRIVAGHCGDGIGGCGYLMNRQWPADGLDALAAEFVSGGCKQAACQCTPPPESVVCVDGHCMAGP
jgi:hypothetical protein